MGKIPSTPRKGVILPGVLETSPISPSPVWAMPTIDAEDKKEKEDVGFGRAIPVIQGLLKKHPAAGKGSMSSQKRWVTLTQDRLTYFPTLHDYMTNHRGKSIILMVKKI